MSQVKIRYTLEKETKRTVRYQEVENDMPGVDVVQGKLYVQKHALEQLQGRADGAYPGSLIVTLEMPK